LTTHINNIKYFYVNLCISLYYKQKFQRHVLIFELFTFVQSPVWRTNVIMLQNKEQLSLCRKNVDKKWLIPVNWLNWILKPNMLLVSADERYLLFKGWIFIFVLNECNTMRLDSFRSHCLCIVFNSTVAYKNSIF